MADRCRFPVFFEAPGLDETQRKRIQNYFRITSKSGGGESSNLTNISNCLFTISFQEQKVQQRVLQRSPHKLEIAGIHLVLNVRDRQDPSAAAPLTPHPSQAQRSIFASGLPPSGESYELQLDSYLLRYLTESPEAARQLEEELSAVSCSAQLYPDEGRVSARCSVLSGAEDGSKTWVEEVKELFRRVQGRYVCHYEMDPHKIKALLRSCGSGRGQVKVYSEVGVAVVVGEPSQVKAALDVEDPHAGVRQTSTIRLGEAKLRLLQREIEQRLQRDFPRVKVAQGDAGQLVLEGSAEGIVKARDWITDRGKSVFERSVAGMSPNLLVFLMEAYGGRGALSARLNVGEKVEVEIRDSELRLFSLVKEYLDETEKNLRAEFVEVSIDVPVSSDVIAELREKLESKVSEMNRGERKVWIVFGQGNAAPASARLLGRRKEVEELHAVVAEFILDQANVESRVILPFPELAQLLPQLLQLHGLDFSGVTFFPLTSHSGPMALLQGPSNKVTGLRNRLGPLLDSLVQETISIDLPGVHRYFQSPSGIEDLSKVSRSNRCLLRLEEPPRPVASAATLAHYNLQDGLQVLVCGGDISRQHADALVNAANENLEHGGGVAGALSRAGGPEVQRESRALVKQIGRIPTGSAVVTSGGKLNCKKLLHVVGPTATRSGGNERAVLLKAVHSALDLAESFGFQSLAMPCISSGVFGVPVAVCSEAIVTAVKEFGSRRGRSLRQIILIDTRPEVVRALREACDRLLRGTSAGDLGGSPFPRDARGGAAGGPGEGVRMEIVQGTVETQQVDALVSPMSGHDPLSTRVGQSLSFRVGQQQLSAEFHRAAGGASDPGDIVSVWGLPHLQSKAVIFLHLVSGGDGRADKVLRGGIQKVLASCESNHFGSVAFPVIGTGPLLKLSHSAAAKVLLEEVREFERTRTGTASFLVRVVVHPSDKESSKAFQCAQTTVRLRGFTNDADPDHASFYRHVSSTAGTVTALLGRVQLELLQGDVTQQTTDVIVNSTDFSSQTGISKALLTAAGPSVQQEFARAGVPADRLCSTSSGLLGCKEIVHASFQKDPQVFLKHCRKIVGQCETKRYQSVTFPAVNTGAAGMDPAKAAKALLDGIASAVTDLKPSSLSLVRIVVLKQTVLAAFRSELERRLGQITPCRLSLAGKARQILKKHQEKDSRTSKSMADISSRPPPTPVSVIGCGSHIFQTVKTDLEKILQLQLVEREVDARHFSRLDAMELEAVLAKVRLLGVALERRRRQTIGAGAGGRNTEEEVYVLKGVKEDVLSINELLNQGIHTALSRDLLDKDAAMMALAVQWSILGAVGVWHEVSLLDNYRLEKAHESKQVFVDVKAPDGSLVKVNLKSLHATDTQTGSVFKMKRMEHESPFALPQHWEPMENETFKKVTLEPATSEYKEVAQGFHRTAKDFKIHKIERVQNVFLWHAYTVCQQRILARNGPQHVGEKFLYHGSSAEACNCIEKDRFDRSYAGTHAAMYGKGVYFAVNAEYSARRFSPPDPSGMKRLYVARVLTGYYTVGKSRDKAPPPRGSDPTDCFDSLVDNQQTPSMFVIFHDDQAYPEHLITFS